MSDITVDGYNSDGYIGLLKRKVSISDIDTMTQVVAAVEGSSHVNEAQVFDW